MSLDQQLPPTDVDSLGRGVAAAECGYAAALAAVLAVDEVPVDSHFFDDLGADSMLMARFCARVRKVPDLPAVSMTDVYRFPSVRGLAREKAASVSTPVEDGFAEVLAGVLDVDRVPVDAHFFDDLGADSMSMTRFCAKVRKRGDLPPVAITDVYRHPTVASLAAALAVTGTAAAPTPPEPVEAAPAQGSARARSVRYVVCGAAQAATFVGYAYAAALGFQLGFDWISEGDGLLSDYLRSAAVGSAYFLVVCLFPVVAKWLLVGRWTPRRFPVWGLAYYRFWVVKTLVTANPLVLFAGSPVYPLYLRMLGARIGRDAVIHSRRVPVCADLFTAGQDAVIRKDSFFLCYRARAGWIETGPVTLGDGVLVSEMTVLDIGTSMGDGAQLGHASSLHVGQSVPAGEHWGGSPAERTGTEFLRVPPLPPSRRRKVTYAALQLLTLALVYLPLSFGALATLLDAIPWLAALLDPSHVVFTSWSFYGTALVVSAVFYFGFLFLRLVSVLTVPRLLDRWLRPDRVYPLYGWHYGVHRAQSRLSNDKFLTALFGDSSYIVPYLRGIGYHLTPVVQSGSNFGTDVKHESPFLVTVGTGTVCASELSLLNAHYSSSSFRLTRATIGAHNFLGNMIAYPAGSRTRDNCLLATKVMVPVDGPIREDVGLLGSPSFEIPRTVERDSHFVQRAHAPDVPRRLAAKNRHNLATIGFSLLSHWFFAFVTFVVGFVTADLYQAWGARAVAASTVFLLVFVVLYSVLVERASTGFRGLRPAYCSIYDKQFWQVERFFKHTADAIIVLNGTPFKAPVLRLLGMRVGKRLFDDGCGFAEKNLVSIGDDVTFNLGSNLQCHSQEDYAFKSDRIAVGSRCTVGVGALVHYGTSIGDGAEVAADAFLMKGEEMPADARWGGNPARDMRLEEPRLPVPRQPTAVGGPRPADARPATVARPASGVRGRLRAAPRPRRAAAMRRGASG
jgi:non-ribosomal peptide synthetase-like protein